MTLKEAIAKLTDLYEWAKKQENIHKPLAYALYRVWIMADRRKK